MDQSNGSEAGSAARDDYLQLHAEYVRSIKTLLSSLQPKFESSLHSFKEFQRCVAEGAAWGWAWGRRMTEFFFDLSLPEDLEVVRNYTHTPEPEVHKVKFEKKILSIVPATTCSYMFKCELLYIRSYSVQSNELWPLPHLEFPFAEHVFFVVRIH
jgi:hypothetical protein